MAAVKAEFLPVALAGGWTLDHVDPAPRGGRRYGMFGLARDGRERDVALFVHCPHGDRPDVWLSCRLIIKDNGLYALGYYLTCRLDTRWKPKGSFSFPFDNPLTKPTPITLQEAPSRALRCLEIVERFLDAGTPNPHLHVLPLQLPRDEPTGEGDEPFDGARQQEGRHPGG